jgi:hypothetical protein
VPRETKPKVVELLEELVADTASPGHLYQIQPDDTPLSVALEALGPGATVDDAISYLHCISSGPLHNMRLYATPSTSKAYPSQLMVPTANIGIRVAFLPRNEDALDVMLRGRRPQMTVDPRTGAPLGGGETLGLIWLPPVDEKFSCAGYEWEDGSSAIDPPPDLLERLH